MITIMIDEFGKSVVYSASFEDILNKVSSDSKDFIVYNLLLEEYTKINDVKLLSEKGVIICFQKDGKKTLQIDNMPQKNLGNNISCLSSEQFNEEIGKLDTKNSLKLYTTMSQEEINEYFIQEQINNCSQELFSSSLDDIIDYDYELLENLTKINSKTLKKSRH